MNIFEHKCYRTFLNDFLELKRCDRISLRQQAQRIGISYSRLWEVCQRQGHFSNRTIYRVLEYLKLPTQEEEYFLLLYKEATTKSGTERKRYGAELSKIRYRNHYEAIDLSDRHCQYWYHYTILFLISTEPNLNLDQIAQRLGLTSSLVESSIMDLQRDGLLNIQEGSFSSNNGYFKVMPMRKSKVVQNFHSSMIQKSLDAMKRSSLDKRHFCTHIFTLDERRYRKLTETIENFLAEESSKDEARNSEKIYCMATQLFPLSH